MRGSELVEVEVEVEGDASSRAGVSTWVVVNREVEGEGLRSTAE